MRGHFFCQIGWLLNVCSEVELEFLSEVCLEPDVRVMLQKNYWRIFIFCWNSYRESSMSQPDWMIIPTVIQQTINKIKREVSWLFYLTNERKETKGSLLAFSVLHIVMINFERDIGNCRVFSSLLPSFRKCLCLFMFESHLIFKCAFLVHFWEYRGNWLLYFKTRWCKIPFVFNSWKPHWFIKHQDNVSRIKK